MEFEDKKPLDMSIDESNVEFKTKENVGHGDRCIVFSMIFGLVLMAVFAVVIVVFGVIYYQTFISGDLEALEKQVSALEMQLNQSRTDASNLQAQLSSSGFMAQIDLAVSQVQNARQQLTTQTQSLGSTLSAMLDQITTNTTQQIVTANLDDINMQVTRAQLNYRQTVQNIENNLGALRGQSEITYGGNLDSFRMTSISAITSEQGGNFTNGIVAQLGGGTRSSYVRWGSDSCPGVAGTTLIYSGLMGGTAFTNRGGAHNPQCLPMDPDIDALPTEPGRQGFSVIWGAEYALDHYPHDHNLPCAVCSVTIGAEVIMIPNRNSCPSSWTKEYDGYLMSEGVNNFRTSFVCVDQARGVLPNSGTHSVAMDVFLVKIDCNSLFCPPFNASEVAGCVVCSK